MMFDSRFGRRWRVLVCVPPRGRGVGKRFLAMNMNRRSFTVLAALSISASLWSEGALSASQPLRTLPLGRDIWLTGTIQRGNDTNAPGDDTTIMLDRASTSPCDDSVVTDILLGERGAPGPTPLLPYLNQRVAVKGRVVCPGSGTRFTPQPDDVFPVW